MSNPYPSRNIVRLLVGVCLSSAFLPHLCFGGDKKLDQEKFIYSWSSESGTPVFSDQAPTDHRGKSIKKDPVKALPSPTSSTPPTLPNVGIKSTLPAGLPPIPLLPPNKNML